MREVAGQHVVVIGAGVIGINCALSLQHRGFRVTVVDPRAPGTATSSGNAGCIAIAEILPVSMPGLIWSVPAMLADPLGPLSIRWRNLPSLAPWLWRFILASRRDRVEEIATALASLLRRAWPDYQAVLARTGLEHLIRQNGHLYVYETAKSFAGAADAWALRSRKGVRARTVGAGEIRALEPGLAPIFSHGYFVPESAQTVDPLLLTTALAAHFEAQGGVVRTAEVERFVFSDTKPRSVCLKGGGSLSFDMVVVAAGAWSRALCRALGHAVPLDTERGYNTTLPSAGVALTRPVSVPERHVVLAPIAGGIRIGGSVELASLEAKPNFARSKALLAQGLNVMPGLDTTGAREWMGCRPSLPDSKPVIARSPRHRNLLFALGHGHLGVTLGAVTGRLIAELAAGEIPSVDLTPFAIDRF